MNQPAVDLSVIIPTYQQRSRKRRTLLSGIGSSAADHERFEVILVVDGADDSPLQDLALIPKSIHTLGLTQPHRGPAAARNLGIAHARGKWLLFFDDDARVDERTISGHLDLIARNSEDPLAYLGAVHSPEDAINSPWRLLLAKSSMVFFRDRMTPGRRYGYRHFWTSNLSVRRDLVEHVGGFSEDFTEAMHEDIELGFRLERRHGLKVLSADQIHSWHDHELDPQDYFDREHRSGRCAHSARRINREFHDDIWQWVGDARRTFDSLLLSFREGAKEVLKMLESWSQVSEHRPSGEQLRAMYLAHLPLKRLCFCCGYAQQPFEEFWESLTG